MNSKKKIGDIELRVQTLECENKIINKGIKDLVNDNEMLKNQLETAVKDMQNLKKTNID